MTCYLQIKVFGLTDVVVSDVFTLTSSLHYIYTRGHAYKLYLHNSRIGVRSSFFLNVYRTL